MSKPPTDKEGWITVAKKVTSKPTPSQPQKWFVVFAGHQPGIYADWSDCQKQIKAFNGSCFKAYDTLIEAQQVFYTVGQASQNLFKTKEDQVQDFFNPGLPNDIYTELNGVWRMNKLGRSKQYRQHLSSLAALIAEQTAMTVELKKLCIKICLTIDWEKNFTLSQINYFLKLAQLVGENDFPHNTFAKINRICLFEKTKDYFPPHLFRYIMRKTTDHVTTIQEFYLHNHEDINCHDAIFNNKKIPKLNLFIVPGFPWSMEPVDWGVVNHITFSSQDAMSWNSFPAMIKSMIYKVSAPWMYSQNLTFVISSSIGWREPTRFFQPYQIWFLKKSSDDDLEHTPLLNSRELAENISPRSLAINSFVFLQHHAHEILNGQFNHGNRIGYCCDGRRLFITDLIIHDPNYSVNDIQIAKEFLRGIIDGLVTIPDDIRSGVEDLTLEWELEEAQSPASTPPLDEYELHNIINAMEG